jgi:predicted S18 family serine protease
MSKKYNYRELSKEEIKNLIEIIFTIEDKKVALIKKIESLKKSLEKAEVELKNLKLKK